MGSLPKDELTAADVRAIIAKGWSSRGGDPASEGADIELPENCYGLDKVPHGWLFPQGLLISVELSLTVQSTRLYTMAELVRLGPVCERAYPRSLSLGLGE